MAAKMHKTAQKKWPMVKLGEVLKPLGREESVDPMKEYRLLGIRLDGQGPFLRETVTGSQTAATKFFRVVKGDFIYSRLFAWRGAFGIIGNELDGCYVSNEFPTFRPLEEKIDITYLSYWFRLRPVLDRVAADCTGSTPLTRNRYKENFFLSLQIPLPPLSEQRRIVAKINHLAAKIEQARGLRQHLLQVASAPSASAIRETFSGLLKHTPVSTLGEMTVIIGGGSLPKLDPTDKNNKDTEILLVKVSDMNAPGNEVRLRNSALRLAQDSPQIARLRLLPAGSVIFPKRGGAIATNKKRLLARRAALDPNLMGVFARDANHLDSEYLLNWFVSFDLAKMQTGTSVPQINKSDIEPLRISVPPIEEQHRIVAYLDGVQAKVDQLKALQEKTAAELDALLPSILDKAFKGEL